MGETQTEAEAALVLLIALSFSELMPLSLLPKATPSARLAALPSNCVALSLAAFASNKAEELTTFRRAIGGLLASYWPAKAFWVASEGGNS